MRDNQRVQNDQSEIRLLTHQSQAGAVIGKYPRLERFSWKKTIGSI